MGLSRPARNHQTEGVCSLHPHLVDGRQWIGERSKIKAEEAVHPVLGQLISDLGYKKVYCASIKQLGDVPIWEQQRILRRDRAESIAAEKRKKGFPVQIPGIVTLYSMPDGSFKLLDGQHRFVVGGENGRTDEQGVA